MMKYIKTCPLFLLLLFSGLLFTLAGLGGRGGIYREQPYDPVKEPILAVMFRAMGEEIYPWELFREPLLTNAVPENEEQQTKDEEAPEGEEAKSEAEEAPEGEEGKSETGEAPEGEEGKAEAGEVPEDEEGKAEAGEAPEGEAGQSGNVQPPVAGVPTPIEEGTKPPIQAAVPTQAPVPTPTPWKKLEPLRETTKEEYMKHISADIYGDAGVIRAAEYEFVPITDPEWFSDALFIGDSRTVGLRDYTDLSEYADFYCETSLTIYKVLEKEFPGRGTVAEALAEKDYGKIYLMVGINELGRGTTEDFMEKYTEVVETLRKAEPQALIYIQGIMRVSGQKSSQDAIFNNENINARNHAIATLADNKQIFYIDVNEAVCDEEGNLTAEYTHDQIHLLGMYNELWKEFLMTKGVSQQE